MPDKNTPKPLVLVDGSSYLFRAFHALPPLTNKHGEPTGAMHGVLNMLDRLRQDYQPEHMVVIFDAKGKNFRHAMYPEYKANRPPMPDELRVQIAPLHEIIKAEGYPMIVMPDVEADDVIGAIASQYQGKVLISTGDKDMAQLVTDEVHLINTMSNSYEDVQGVIDKYGVTPERICDYLALIGDKSDNVPGVPKVGPKTAVKWLQKYDSLANIIEHAEEFGGKVGQYLRESLHFLPLSYDLVTIKCDLDIDCSAEALCLKPAQKHQLASLFERYGFRKRLENLNKAKQKPTIHTTHTTHNTHKNKDNDRDKEENDGLDELIDMPSTQTDYQCIVEQQQLEYWIEKLKKAPLFAFDTETTSLDYMQARLVGMSFAVERNEAAYLPLAHDYIGVPKQLDFDRTLALLKPLLEDPKLKKVGQNLKYDRSVLLNHGIELQGIEHDTMLESYVLNPTANRHNMDTLAEQHLNRKTIHFEDIAGKGKKQLSFNQIAFEEAVPYAAEDADITLQLHQTLWPQLKKRSAQAKLYRDIECPLLSVLSTIERNGVRIDSSLLNTQSKELKYAMTHIEANCYDLADETFKLNSPKQLQAILFEKMDLPVIRKTPKGQPSTAEDVLQELATQGHELPQQILQYRSMSKLCSTYTSKLPKLVNDDTQRIHTSYHQAVTATGRLSSSNPNLQNIPIRSKEGRRIRQAFIARDGYCVVAADYSQIELRIMAHLSADQSLLTAFSEDKDIHTATAAEVFSVPLNAVSDNQRRDAKAINFGLIYGMSAFGLAKQLGIGRQQAQNYIDTYFARYPGVQDYMEQTREYARTDGYVETLFGRRLYFPDINAKNHRRKQAAERTAINAPMQGTAADIIKKAMIDTDSWLKTNRIDALMTMQVHDELVFEVKEADAEDFSKILQQHMENAADLDVPLLVSIGIGDNWDEAH